MKSVAGGSAQAPVSLGLWLAGARLRTLPLAVAPVILGYASAVLAGRWNFLVAGLVLLVALALQVGVNFANDYSDGIRGTDDVRVGPARLTGSGLVPAHLVKRAAFISFGVSAAAGALAVLITQAWMLLVIGAVAIVCAWYYTGGKKPYGYRGLGELVVFIFFGPVATLGTAWVLMGFVPFEAWFTGSAAGFFAAAVLLVNNIRDIEQDTVAGKRALAVGLGRTKSLALLYLLLAMPYVMVGLLSFVFVWAPVVFLTGIMTIVVVVMVALAKTPRDLISALVLMSLNALVFAGALGLAIAL